MIRDGRRDHLAVDMNPLAGMPSSSEGYTRVLFLWFYIKWPTKCFVLHIRGEKSQNNTSDQRTMREALKV